MSDTTANSKEVASVFVVRASYLRSLFYNLLLLGAYWSILTYCYIYGVSPANATETSMYLRPDALKIAESIFWAVLLLPTINTLWRRASDFGFMLLYFIGFVPTLIIYGLSGQPRTSLYIIVAGYVAAFVACRAPIHIPYLRLRQGSRSGIYFAAFGVLTVLLWFVIKGNPRNLNANIFAVYDYRKEAVSLFSFGPLAYLAAWMPRILCPFLFCYFFLRKRWILFGITFFVQLFCVVIFQEKSVIVPIVLLPMLYMVGRGPRGQLLFILCLVATAIPGQFLYEHYHFAVLSQLWTRRFFFIQQFLYFNYIDIFRHIGHVQYTDSFMSNFFNYPFPYKPGELVGYYIFLNPIVDANTGFFGAGYMEFGAWGVVLNGVAVGLILKLFDRVTPIGLPMWFFGTTACLPFMALLVAQNVNTSILSAGIVVLFALMLGSRQFDLSERRAIP